MPSISLTLQLSFQRLVKSLYIGFQFFIGYFITEQLLL